MATTETAVRATMAANAGGVRVEGDVRRDGDRFAVYVRGRQVAQAGSLGGAARRLAEALARDLPRQTRGSWGVEVHCSAVPGIGLLFGNAQSGFGGSGGTHPCVARVAGHYRRGQDNLQRALEFAAKLLAECCAD